MGVENIHARLMPVDVLLNKPAEVKKLLMDVRNQLGPINYFLGGNIHTLFSANDTAIHPANRNAIWNIVTFDPVVGQKIREFIPNNVTGVGYNHHYRLEPDWHNACWGSHYERLLELKTEFDHKGILNCWHCVGWRGADPSTKAPTPALTQQPSSPSVISSRAPSSFQVTYEPPTALATDASAPTHSPQSPSVMSSPASNQSISSRNTTLEPTANLSLAPTESAGAGALCNLLPARTIIYITLAALMF